MFCSNCGTKITGTEAFCPNCGCKVEREEEVAEAVESEATEVTESKAAEKAPETVESEAAEKTPESDPLDATLDKDEVPDKIRAEVKAIWPDWTLEKVLGHGSFGTVYKAKRSELGEDIYSAIKIIRIPQNEAEIRNVRSDMGLDEQASTAYFKGLVDDCVNEIKLMESLKSAPNVVTIEDYKVKEGKKPGSWVIYIRMELLESFDEFYNSATFTQEDAIELGIDVCTALESCAKDGVMHRDIKPENIFKSRLGGYKLGDFGIARKLENSSMGMSKKGTYNYMAPEVYNGRKDYDGRSDIYSLGIVLYKLLNNNRFPFLKTDSSSVTYQEALSALEERMKGTTLPKPANAGEFLSDVIMTACSSDPETRFGTATAFKNALLQAKNELNGTVQTGSKSDASDDLDKTVGVGTKKGAAEDFDKTVAISGNGKGAVATAPAESAKETKKAKSSGSKGVVILVVALIAVIAIAAIAGVVVYKIYNSPKQRVMRALEEGDLDKANEILDEDRDVADNSAVADNLRKRIEEIRNDFAEEEKDYAEAKSDLEEIQKLQVSAVESELKDAFDYLERVNNSRICFNTAEHFMETKDYPNAMKQYALVIEEDSNYSKAKEQSAKAIELFRTSSLENAKAKADAEDYQGAIDILDSALFTLPNDAAITQQLTIYQNAYEAKKKDEIYNTAESYASRKQYLEAMSTMDDYLASDPSDAEAKSRRQKYYNAYVEDVIDQANTKVAAGDYGGAVKTLDLGLVHAPDERKLTDKKAEIKDRHIQQILENSQEMLVESDWAGAVKLLEEGTKLYPDDERLSDKYAAFKEQHILNFLNEADSMMDAGDFDGALAAVQQGQEYYPNEERFRDKLTEIEEKRPVSFKVIEKFNGGFEWDTGTPEDPFGNDYSNDGDYIVYTGKGYDYTEYDQAKHASFYCKYKESRIYGKYKKMTGTLAPHASIEKDALCLIKVFGDDKLIYTSKFITKKTDAFTFTVDISNVDYLKVVLYTSYSISSTNYDRGGMILSNPQLYPN